MQGLPHRERFTSSLMTLDHSPCCEDFGLICHQTNGLLSRGPFPGSSSAHCLLRLAAPCCLHPMLPVLHSRGQ